MFHFCTIELLQYWLKNIYSVPLYILHFSTTSLILLWLKLILGFIIILEVRRNKVFFNQMNSFVEKDGLAIHLHVVSITFFTYSGLCFAISTHSKQVFTQYTKIFLFAFNSLDIDFLNYFVVHIYFHNVLFCCLSLISVISVLLTRY